MMFKLAALSAVAALDTEAPVISLDMANVNNRQPYKLQHRIEHTHAKNEHGESVFSYQDFSVRCAAGHATSKNCPAPQATAFDHHDGKLAACPGGHPTAKNCLSTRLFLVNTKPSAVKGVEQPDQPCTDEKKCERTSVDYTQRSTYLYKFDAKDQSGNRAHQVVFALILDDLHAPQIFYQGDDASCKTAWAKKNVIKNCNEKGCKNRKSCFPVLANEQIIEAASDWELPGTSRAMDNIDGDVVSTLEYKVEYLNERTQVYEPYKATNTRCQLSKSEDCYVKYSTAKQIIDTTRKCHHSVKFDNARESKCESVPECHYRVTLKANDFAKIYGHSGEDNTRLHSVHLVVKDTRPPVIQIQGADPMQVECNRANKGFTFGEKNSKGTFAAISGYNAGSNACKSDPNHDFCASGADVLDLQDTEALKRVIEYKVTHSGKPKRFAQFGQRSAPLPISLVGNYKVHFNAKDHACNDADEVTREVAVVDTKRPEIKLVGKATITLEDGTPKSKTLLGGKSWSQLESHTTGVQCWDQCSLSDKVRITSHWSPSPYTPTGGGTGKSASGPGTYVQTFRCFDQDSNSAEITRTYIVEDNGQPIISLLGDTTNSLEASKDSEYTDAGARCSDFSDGQIDHQVVIHGDVVNYRVPGTYKIRFDCEDSSGNDADQLTRTVVIEDTVCPYVKLAGHTTQTVEAGFPYEDVGATATDTLDGDLTSNLKISDGPFAAHYNNERSCAAIKFRAPGAKSGNYNILVTINGHHQFLPVYCDMTNKATFFIHKGHRTFHGDIKEPEMIKAYGKNNGACGSYGLKMAMFANSATESAAFNYASELEEGNCPACIQGGKNGVFSRSVKTTDYFCMPIDEDVKGLTGSEKYNNKKSEYARHLQTNPEDQIAIPGTYIMTFRVRDKEGNGWTTDKKTGWKCKNGAKCCANSEKKRTVVVVDTLPPVITLSLKGELIQKSFGDSRGYNGEINPAGRSSKTTTYAHSGLGHKANLVSGNPFLEKSVHDNGLTRVAGGAIDDGARVNQYNAKGKIVQEGRYMAEQTTSVNGWMIGAVASAVAGVALMGFSMKSTTQTTVPV
jgi:hypothetical protein